MNKLNLAIISYIIFGLGCFFYASNMGHQYYQYLLGVIFLTSAYRQYKKA